MTTKTLDDVMKRVLNDPDIFGPPYDKNAKSTIPLLFETREWKQLKETFEKGDKDSLTPLWIVNVKNFSKKSKIQTSGGRIG